MRKAKKILFHTLILTLTSLIMRTVGVSFHVFISNRIGAGGLGLFGLIMSVYTFAVTLAISGIRLTTTKLVAEELAKGQGSTALLAVKRCLLYSLFFGGLASIGLILCADWVGTSLLGDARTIPSLYVLAFSLIPVAMCSVLTGYFLAVRKAVKSAAAQFLEQLLRIGIVVFGLNFIAPSDIEKSCLLMVFGTSASEVFSFLLHYCLYRLDRHQIRKDNQKAGTITGRMMRIAIPLAISDYARSVLSAAEHLLIPRKLSEHGYSKDAALSQYGRIHGMALSVLTFPSAFLGAFSSLLMPEIAESYAKKNMRRIYYIMTRVLKLAFIFAVFVGGVFLFFSKELSQAIYGSYEIAPYLCCLSPLLVVIYTDDVVDALLKGLDQQVSSMRYNLLDSFLGVVLVCLLIPRFGAGGYIAVIYITEMINGILSMNRLIKVTDFSLNIKDFITKPVLSALLAAGLVKLVFFHNAFSVTILAAMIVLMLLFYVLILLVTSCITREDFSFFATLFRKGK
ncbi:MAG: polysaccharide biosynthesis C-terminal domain-containing protein [Clostridia bacterium]|nr:polysaccharide biosynthesis C-terminal domain-containing protein [Clostridia bacterium]